MSKKSINDLANEYEQQFVILDTKLTALTPLLCVYTGEDLYKLRRQMKIYYDMANDCRRIASLLNGYYDYEEESDL